MKKVQGTRYMAQESHKAQGTRHKPSTKKTSAKWLLDFFVTISNGQRLDSAQGQLTINYQRPIKREVSNFS